MQNKKANNPRLSWSLKTLTVAWGFHTMKFVNQNIINKANEEILHQIKPNQMFSQPQGSTLIKVNCFLFPLLRLPTSLSNWCVQ